MPCPALLSLALPLSPLVTPPAAGTCCLSAPPPVRLPPGPHTQEARTQASRVGQPPTAIHAACSRIAVVVGAQQRQRNPLCTLPALHLRFTAPPPEDKNHHPPPAVRRDSRHRRRRVLIDIGIGAESCCSRSRSRLPVTHCRKSQNPTNSENFLAAGFLVRAKFIRIVVPSVTRRPLTVCSTVLCCSAGSSACFCSAPSLRRRHFSRPPSCRIPATG